MRRVWRRICQSRYINYFTYCGGLGCIGPIQNRTIIYHELNRNIILNNLLRQVTINCLNPIIVKLVIKSGTYLQTKEFMVYGRELNNLSELKKHFNLHSVHTSDYGV
jgi:hypothetical protein